MNAFYDRALSRPATQWPIEKTRSWEQATYVVLGNPHGGTTLIAGLLRIFGLFMGRQIDSWTQEDIAMRTDDLEDLVAIIDNRNKEHDRWGWKCPGSVRYLGALKDYLRNPKFIAVYRDPYAATLRNVKEHGRDSIECIEEWSREFQLQLQIIKGFAVPSLLVSYEMALKKPRLLIEDFAKFLGRTDMDAELEDRLYRYIRPDGGYAGVIDPSAPLPEIDTYPFGVRVSSGGCCVPLRFERPFGLSFGRGPWVMHVSDPHCFVADPDVLRLPGVRLVRIEVKACGNRLIEPSLYLDIGFGLREDHRIRFGRISTGIWEYRVDFPATVGAVRFDPDEESGVIERLVISIM